MRLHLTEILILKKVFQKLKKLIVVKRRNMTPSPDLRLSMIVDEEDVGSNLFDSHESHESPIENGCADAATHE